MQAGIEEQSALYEKRIPIFPRAVKGRFRRFKWGVLILAYSVFFGLVWLPWPRHDGPSQAVMFDLVHRKFYIFGLVAYPQDLIVWLGLLLFIAAALLFFVTALVGRAFCGYFCFQTLWTDFFVWIENLIQGDRPKRVRLYKQPWNREKILKLGTTHFVWLLVSFWTAFTFAAYFTYAPELVRDFFTGQAHPAAYATVLILTLTTYVAAGLGREQICMYVCPYARFQSVMYDPETLVVTYDEKRGDGRMGRAPLRPGAKTREERRAKGYGDCIDCTLCVQVCPVGIDIRNGLQYPCISCGLCIDACDGVMDSIGFPRGLIRYDCEVNIKSPAPGKPHLHWKRLKVIGYGLAVVVMSALLVHSIANRSDLEQAVTQVRQPLYVVLSDGQIRNRYQIRLANRSDHAETYALGVRGIPAQAADFGNFQEVTVKPDQSILVQVSVKLPPEAAMRVESFEFTITPRSRPAEVHVSPARFYGPHS
ncbi:cytochrome c oxidase accessory protein CcoG [Thiobacter aerophilum]|uniref:Cytochrome c oxidase accessory protein CcoG n=1 Tax=Thiobacter aerophilum TaxID=3121275 RepID=A0ABV0EG64_9BURK